MSCLSKQIRQESEYSVYSLLQVLLYNSYQGRPSPKGNESELPPCFVLPPASLPPISYRPIFPPLSKKLTWEIRSPLLFQWIIPIHGYYEVDAPDSYCRNLQWLYGLIYWLQILNNKNTCNMRLVKQNNAADLIIFDQCLHLFDLCCHI